MTVTLPSSGQHWIEPASSGVASVARPRVLTEVGAGVFEFVTTGTAAEIIARATGVFEIVSEYTEAGLVESPTGVFTITPGVTSTAVLVESPSGVFTITPAGTETAQVFGSAAGLYQIIPTADSARATVLALASGTVTNVVLY